MQLTFSAIKTRVVARGQKKEGNISKYILWRRFGLAHFYQKIFKSSVIVRTY